MRHASRVVQGSAREDPPQAAAVPTTAAPTVCIHASRGDAPREVAMTGGAMTAYLAAYAKNHLRRLDRYVARWQLARERYAMIIANVTTAAAAEIERAEWSDVERSALACAVLRLPEMRRFRRIDARLLEALARRDRFAAKYRLG